MSAVPSSSTAADSPTARTVIAGIQRVTQLAAEERCSTVRVPYPDDETLRLITDLDIEEADELNSLVAGGVGSEDDGDHAIGDDDELDDESTNMASTSKRRSHPLWFQSHLDAVLSTLDTANGRQICSNAGTFWIHPKSAWFVLRKVDVKPSDIFLPAFFIWDPHQILGKDAILCPKCRGACLTRDGVVRRPRRIIDVDRCFWIIGYSYECPSCKSKFRSWDRRILAMIPRPLALEFPAYLTWRSGISMRALGLLRSCSQHGMGMTQIAEMFRNQYLRGYDELKMQYLHTKVPTAGLPGQTYIPFPPFEDLSPNGFHGSTPSATWLRDVYISFIEHYKDVLNQHTAMLSGRVCAIDHSHKVGMSSFLSIAVLTFL